MYRAMEQGSGLSGKASNATVCACSSGKGDGLLRDVARAEVGKGVAELHGGLS